MSWPLRNRALSCLLVAGLFCTGAAEPVFAGNANEATRGEYQRFAAFAHLDMAHRLVAQGQPEEALRELDAYFSIVPEDMDARLMYIRLLYRLARHPEAAAQARALLAREPERGEAGLYLGMSLLELGDAEGAAAAFESAASARDLTAEQRRAALASAIDAARKSGDRAGTRVLLARLLAEHPDDVDVLRALIDLELARGRMGAALVAARRLVQAAPTPAHREILANVLVQNGEPGEAAGIYADLARAAGGDDAARLSMASANALLAAGQPGAAAQAFERAARTLHRPAEDGAPDRPGDPDRPGQAGKRQEALQAAAFAWQQAGNADAAIADITKVLELDDTPGLHLMAGQLYRQTGRNAEAAERFRAAARQEAPDDVLRVAIPALLDVLSALGRDAEALAVLREARQRGVAVSSTLAAQVLERAGDADGALRLLQDTPPAGDAAERARQLEQAGHLLARMGRQAEAGERFLLAARTDPRSATRYLYMAAVTFVGAGERARAMECYEAYLQRGSEPGRMAEAWLALGNLRVASGDTRRAAQAFARALDGPGFSPSSPRRVAALSSLLEVQAANGNHEAVRIVGQRLLAVPGLARQTAAATHVRVAEALVALDRAGEALPHLDAAADMGGDSPDTLRAIAFLEYDLGRYADAVRDFSRVLEHGDTPGVRLGLARALARQGKTGLAVHHYLLAGEHLDDLPPDGRMGGARHAYWAELGMLYDTEGQYAQAATAYSRALEAGNDPILVYRLGRALRLAGQPDEAAPCLAALDPDEPDGPLARAGLVPQVWAERAALAGQRGDRDEEVRLLERALEHVPGTPEDAAARGMKADLLARLGHARALQSPRRNAAEVLAYTEAVRLSDSPAVRSALGYALFDAGDYPGAASTFDEVVAGGAAQPELIEDTAYAWYRAGENDMADRRFREAIDALAEKREEDDGEGAELGRRTYALRQEVAKIERELSLALFMSYQGGDAARGMGATGSDVVRANSGMEATWVPPGIGLVDDRLFQFVGRVTWSQPRESLELEQGTAQGAAGVRYKPLRDGNLHFGVERLMAIGDDAEDNWLLRALWSVSDGADVHTGDPLYNYSLLYAEGGHYAESPSRSSVYVEGRQGLTFNHGDTFLVRPHLFAAVRKWTPDRDDASYYEAGPGVSLSWLFNETPYSTPRSSFEVMLHYGIGRFYNQDGDDTRTDGLILTTTLSF